MKQPYENTYAIKLRLRDNKRSWISINQKNELRDFPNFEPPSGGLPDASCSAGGESLVPIDLWDTAVKKNQSDSYFTSNDLTNKVPNPIHHLFGANNERIAVCPLLTDANDWGIIRDVQDVPIVEMSYLNGREDPEFIYEKDPRDEHILKGDKWGYKVRHEYGGALADYRGAYKFSVT